MARFLTWCLSLFLLSFSCTALPAPQAAPSEPPGTPEGLFGTENLLGPDGAPVDSAENTIQYQLAPGQEADADLGFHFDFTEVDNPQPIRGTEGSTDPGPRNYRYDVINSDLFDPPGTDSGAVPNAKWPMGLSHNRLGIKNGGWARQQNVDNLPAATAMAGVDMRLAPNSYRELHWHKANEWSLILNGSVRVQAVNQDGETFVDDLSAGDVWYFPAGVPHSIQAFDEGTEFLLVFDEGSFSEDNTFLASELFLRNPKAVLAKDLETSVDAFNNIPTDQLYIFPGTPAPLNISEQNVTGDAGIISGTGTYSYHFSQQAPYEVDGGSVKIIDPSTFPIADMFSAALVTIKPGAMREIHWHLTSDEWTFFIAGSGRVTVFAAPESAQTFDFQAGDVAYIPVVDSHYIENTSADEDLIVLEVLQAPKFTDMSMSQWIALTPPQIFKDTLDLSAELIAAQPKEKTILKPGSTNLTETDFTPS